PPAPSDKRHISDPTSPFHNHNVPQSIRRRLKNTLFLAMTDEICRQAAARSPDVLGGTGSGATVTTATLAKPRAASASDAADPASSRPSGATSSAPREKRASRSVFASCVSAGAEATI